MTVVCFSCAPKEKSVGDGDPIVAVVKDVPREILDISGCVDSVRQIVLETTDRALVGEIRELVIHDDWIALRDRGTQPIRVFGFDGAFIRNIGSIGRGPGEYLDVSKLLFDEEKEQFVIYDADQRSLLFYDLGGKYIRTIENFGDRAPVRDIIPLSSGGFLCVVYDWSPGATEDDLVGVWETDSEGKFVRYLIRYADYWDAPWQDTYMLYNSPDTQAGYFDPNTYDVYSYRGDSISKKVIYDFPGRRTMKDFKGVVGLDPSKENFVGIYQAYHKGGYIFTTWIDHRGQPQSSGFVSLVSTETGEVKTGGGFSPLIEDKLVGYSYFPNNTDNILTATVSAGMLLSIATSEQISDVYKKPVEKLVGERTEDQIADMNPVITLLYIKK